MHETFGPNDFTAEDVAESIIWLLDAAHTVTGEFILLDSGLHLGAKPVTLPAQSQ